MRIREKLRWVKKVLFPGSRRRLPEQVVFFITDKCNLACAHCFYWKRLNKETNEASLEEIERFSRSMGHFSFLTLTGGEPFLRADIPDIVKIFKKNNSVSRVSIPTNGFFTESILHATAQILRENKDIDLSVKISLDGPEATHDAIRGARGVFLKAVDTCHGLLRLKKENPAFKVGVIMTYSALNQESLPEALDYIETDLNPDLISLSFVRGDVKDQGIKDADAAKYLTLYRMILSRSLRKGGGRRSLSYKFYRAYKSKISELVAHTLQQKRCVFPCRAGRLLCIIDSALNVYPCELLERGFGNIRAFDYDFRKLWFSEDAESLRKQIISSRCWCTYECGLQISALFNVKTLFSCLQRMLCETPP